MLQLHIYGGEEGESGHLEVHFKRHFQDWEIEEVTIFWSLFTH